ncbi:MAG UNVERIFIED_CONTAM: hypothetical protein LVR18_37365 [Planctomycetaceae bacterium]
MSPRPGSLSSDCCESAGSIGANERSIVARTAPPEAAGIVPATGGRRIATVENLRVLSALTNDPSPFTLPLPAPAGIVPATGVAE